PGLLVDQVDPPGVARRDQDVAALSLLDRVKVEVVVLFTGGVWEVTVADRHVAKRVPFPDHLAGRDVDFLDDPVPDAAIRRSPHGCEIGLRGCQGRDESGRLRALTTHDELMLVSALTPIAVPGGDRVDRLIVAVEDQAFPSAAR